VLSAVQRSTEAKRSPKDADRRCFSSGGNAQFIPDNRVMIRVRRKQLTLVFCNMMHTEMEIE
jgi:hypothetical protein